MKKLYILLVFAVLASCGEANVDTTAVPSPTEQTTQEISDALAELPAETPPVEEEVSEEDVVPEEEPPVEAEVSEEDLVPEEEPPVEDEVKEVVPEEESAVEADSMEDKSEEETETEDEVVVAEPKVVELSTTYTNPKMEAVMNINYSMDAENKISEITVTSPNYKGMNKFNDGIQVVVGMTIDEALEQHVSGSSLATAAFQKVLKDM